MSADLTLISVAEASRRLAAGETSAVALLRAHLDMIASGDAAIRAFLALDAADALARAEASDARRAVGQSRGPLDGVPIAVKDNIAVRGQRLSCASKILENFVSPYDATVITKLDAAGAVIFGRLNMDEFAMGSSTENSAYAKTTNPWDTSRIPGGSSGGSAACVAAGFAPAALGSDTGGSIRQPAGHCGVVGLKPTYGRVSRYGLAAYASSLDQIGPVARTVEDCALLLEAFSGRDAHDGTSLSNPVEPYADAARAKVLPKVVGLPAEYFAEGLDPAVRDAVLAAADWYRAQGCEIRHISLPSVAHAIPAYYIIATAEASSNPSRYDGIRYTRRSERATDAVDVFAKSRGEFFGPEVKKRVILGSFTLSAGFYDAYYGRAQKVRTLIREDFRKAFADGVDVILSPIAPTPAFKLGEKTSDPLSMYLSDLYTISANLASLPALSLPCGFASVDGSSGSKKLPIGLQLTGRPLGEAPLLAAAAAYESAHPYAGQVAPL